MWTAPEIRFSPAKIKDHPYDFSFSGIKTAVLYYLRAHPELNPEIETPAAKPWNAATVAPRNCFRYAARRPSNFCPASNAQSSRNWSAAPSTRRKRRARTPS